MVGLNQVIVLFLLIIIGYLVKKIGIVEESMKKDISNLVINITLPAFIISSMTSSFSVDILKNSFKLIIISFSMYFFAILLGIFFVKFFKIKGKSANIYKYIIAFSNCGFMGYPIINTVLGKQGVFYAAIYNLAFTVLVWTYGVYIIKETSDGLSTFEKIKSMITPALVAVITGFTMFVFQIKLPFVLLETLNLLGSITTPLSMMLIGFILSEIHIKDIISGFHLYILAVIRLLILPGVMFIVLKYVLNFSEYLLVVPVLIAGMPAAANTAIISSKYGGDYQLASKGIFITTLLSIVTIPFLISLLF